MEYAILKTIYKNGSIERTTTLNEKPTFDEAVQAARWEAEYWSYFFYNAEYKKTDCGAQVNYTNKDGNEHYAAIYEVIIK